MKNTKTALLTAVLSLLLCVSMLVGTTFAWFTDTASTGVNKIQAGNLDIQIVDENGDEITNLEWVAADGRAQDQILWEPGARYELQPFAVKNNGNLALKFKFVLTGIVGNEKLLEVIDFTYTANGATYDMTKDAYTLLPGASTELITIKGVMKETAGNEYQGLSIENISITVYATQAMEEQDSFNNEYDKNALLPAIGVGRAPANSPVDVEAGIVRVNVPASLNDKGLDYKLVVETAEVNPTIIIDTNEASESFDITLTDGEGNKVEALGADKVAVTVQYKTGLGEVKVYHKGVEIAGVNYDSATGVITFVTDSFSPYTIVYEKPMWVDHVAEALTVDAEAKTIQIATAEEFALFAKNVNAGTSYGGYTVTLSADIDLSGMIWTPINMKNGVENNITIEGNGHTIKGLYVADYTSEIKIGEASAYSGLFKQFGGTIKNLTMKNSVVIGIRSAVLIGATNKDVTLENVNIIDSEIRSYQKNGGLIGYVRSTYNVGTSTVNIAGCRVENLTFRSYDESDTDAPWQCGAIWGYSDVETIANVTGNTVNNIRIVNDPNLGYNNGENAQLASHAFIGSITNFYNENAERSEANYNKFAVTITNNTIGSSSGFAVGNYASEFCGAFYKTYTSASKPYRFATKVVYNGAVRTINPFATVHEVASQEDLEAVAAIIKPYEIVSIAGDFTMTKIVRFTTNNITLEGNGHTITSDREVDVNKTLIAFGEGGKWCQNILVRNINFNGKGGRVFHFHGGDMSTLENVTIDGEFELAVNFYGTHGAVLNNCDFKSSATEKYANATVFANQQPASQLILNNTTIDDIYVNVINNDANALPKNGVKVVVNSGSSIDTLYLPDGTTLVPYQVNGGTIGAIAYLQ